MSRASGLGEGVSGARDEGIGDGVGVGGGFGVKDSERGSGSVSQIVCSKLVSIANDKLDNLEARGSRCCGGDGPNIGREGDAERRALWNVGEETIVRGIRRRGRRDRGCSPQRWYMYGESSPCLVHLVSHILLLTVVGGLMLRSRTGGTRQGSWTGGAREGNWAGDKRGRNRARGMG